MEVFCLGKRTGKDQWSQKVISAQAKLFLHALYVPQPPLLLSDATAGAIQDISVTLSNFVAFDLLH